MKKVIFAHTCYGVYSASSIIRTLAYPGTEQS